MGAALERFVVSDGEHDQDGQPVALDDEVLLVLVYSANGRADIALKLG